MDEWVHERVNTIPSTTVAQPTHTRAATRLNSRSVNQASVLLTPSSAAEAIRANGWKLLPRQPYLPCPVPLTSNSTAIPDLQCIMKDIQNISKWHEY